MLGEFKILDLINKFNTEKKKLRRELRYTNAVLYRLYSTVTNKSYIGITKNLFYRLFSSKFGHVFRYLGTATEPSDGDLYRDMRKYINSFILEIKVVSNTYKEVYTLENEFIKIYDSYNNGYNSTENGKQRGLKGSKKSRIGRYEVYVHSDNEYKLVDESEKDKYLKDGWKLGKGVSNSTKDTSYVNNGVRNKRISRIILNEFLSANPEYRLGRLTTRIYDSGFKILHKNGVTKKFKADQLEYAYSNGWS